MAAGGNFLKDDLLCCSATEEHGEPVEEFGSRHQIAVLRRQLQRIAQRGNATGNDRNAVDWISVGRTGGHQGMASLMVRYDLLLSLAEYAIFLLETSDNALDSLFQIGHCNGLFILTRRQQGCLVENIGQIGSYKARGAGGDGVQINIGTESHFLGMET